MNDKRYQVFISSTFEDLKEERRAVQDVIIGMGDFPVQMEFLPAADEDQFEFIKKLIDFCDYYILIIAGRYGSIADDGQSYTEKEYRYAVSKEVPILLMLHDDPEKIPLGKSETTDEGKRLLQNFILEASKSRLRKTWQTIDELKYAVRESLDNAKITKSRVGWVRGDSVASIDLLTEVHEIRKENDELKRISGSTKLSIALPPLPSIEESIVFDIIPPKHVYSDGSSKTGSRAQIQSTWINIFPIFSEGLECRYNDYDGEVSFHIDVDKSCQKIGSLLASEISNKELYGVFTISTSFFQKLNSYYIESGLINDNGESPYTDFGQRLSRHMIINRNINNDFEIISGDISTTDDEIPF